MYVVSAYCQTRAFYTTAEVGGVKSGGVAKQKNVGSVGKLKQVSHRSEQSPPALRLAYDQLFTTGLYWVVLVTQDLCAYEGVTSFDHRTWTRPSEERLRRTYSPEHSTCILR